MAESAYLKRLRRAVERSGLTAEPAVAAAPVAELVVSGRLVRAIHQHLLRLRPAVAGKMVDRRDRCGTFPVCGVVRNHRVDESKGAAWLQRVRIASEMEKKLVVEQHVAAR